MAKFFVNPFAISGLKTPIPDTGVGTGPVNYEFGFGTYYALPFPTDPNALPVPLQGFNELMFDTTDAIKQYQTEGTYPWITSVQNLGVPYPYPIYARVRYDAGAGMQVWESQTAANTAVPGADASWLLISAGNTGIRTGMVIPYFGAITGAALPSGYLPCNGATVSRTTYAALLNALTIVQTGTTTNLSAVVTGLTDTSDMYGATANTLGMPVEGTGIQSGTRILSVDSSTQVTLTLAATATGTPSLRFFIVGNGNGTTTFTIPDLRRTTLIGAGGTGSTDQFGVQGTKAGQRGGEEAHFQTNREVGDHVHPYIVPAGAGGAGSPAGSRQLTNDTTGLPDRTAGAQLAFNIMQPSYIANYLIKT